MNKRKLISIAMLIIGASPFIYVLINCIDAAVNGFSFLLAPPEHGTEAFLSMLVLDSYLFWPAYIVGAVLIIIGIRLLFKSKK